MLPFDYKTVAKLFLKTFVYLQITYNAVNALMTSVHSDETALPIAQLLPNRALLCSIIDQYFMLR